MTMEPDKHNNIQQYATMCSRSMPEPIILLKTPSEYNVEFKD